MHILRSLSQCGGTWESPFFILSTRWELRDYGIFQYNHFKPSPSPKILLLNLLLENPLAVVNFRLISTFLRFLLSSKIRGDSSRFLKTNPNEICSHLSEKASKGPISSKIALIKQKERRKRRGRRKKGGEGKKAMVAVLVFIMASLEIVLIVFSIKEVELDKDLARIEPVCTFKRGLYC